MYKVAELRTKLSERGLDTKGVKAVLLKRLTEFVSSSCVGEKRSIEEVEDAEEQPEAKKVEVEEESSEEEQEVRS